MFLPFLNLRIEIHVRQKRLECVLENIILSLEQSRSKSTIDNYRTALRSFIKYAGCNVRLRDVNAHLMEGYQRWLHGHGVCMNTSSCYMRSLRKILNEAGLMDCNDCFKNIFTGNAKTDKRAVTQEDVCTLRDVPLLVKPHLRMTRDMFLFSFYAMGMPFVDLAFLRKNQVKDGYIVYARHKTGQTIRVKIEKPMQDIINMYTREDSPYLFPILTQTEPTAAMREYESQRHRYNRNLKTLAAMTSLHNLTSYVVRHSWASIVRDLGANVSVISKALGHNDIKTTQIYLNEVNDQRVYDANATVISKIISLKLGG